MKFPFFRDRDREKLEAYRRVLEAYADPNNWSNVSCFGHIKRRRWCGGNDGMDLAKKVLEQDDGRNS
ncbi:MULTISPECIES: hypothetical protein [unclassified Microcoleus]|uniref:hypothetical protein n=1 Tax=unclassified Microcoleus TaxID=2642155 RepID=UPI001DDEEE9F|nr:MULTISPECIES: hypothetical protein [unclassified Microcoleus]MCC3464546.1 hypothetical protein [Microcoleus sp. PH2017_06_SFM_O_A]MCC3503047.1 hypothetical protein [Microcoleus sp. PH2017_19_SFW_U_A]MCC3513232.1 hypothetical protein [Microcoleus sp. PH2017_17_BER_D_A]TAE15499.1 MAG: hypothetical protein EAZ94_04375 [Oscillatoriales cyanobacterium]MCC3410549.1 hypothetical protein [Microcoleus sp. PH2017_02_FOX_O_A]